MSNLVPTKPAISMKKYSQLLVQLKKLPTDQRKENERRAVISNDLLLRSFDNSETLSIMHNMSGLPVDWLNSTYGWGNWVYLSQARADWYRENFGFGDLPVYYTPKVAEGNPNDPNDLPHQEMVGGGSRDGIYQILDDEFIDSKQQGEDYKNASALILTAEAEAEREVGTISSDIAVVRKSTLHKLFPKTRDGTAVPLEISIGHVTKAHANANINFDRILAGNSEANFANFNLINSHLIATVYGENVQAIFVGILCYIDDITFSHRDKGDDLEAVSDADLGYNTPEALEIYVTAIDAVMAEPWPDNDLGIYMDSYFAGLTLGLSEETITNAKSLLVAPIEPIGAEFDAMLAAYNAGYMVGMAARTTYMGDTAHDANMPLPKGSLMNTVFKERVMVLKARKTSKLLSKKAAKKIA